MQKLVSDAWIGEAGVMSTDQGLLAVSTRFSVVFWDYILQKQLVWEKVAFFWWMGVLP